MDTPPSANAPAPSLAPVAASASRADGFAFPVDLPPGAEVRVQALLDAGDLSREGFRLVAVLRAQGVEQAFRSEQRVQPVSSNGYYDHNNARVMLETPLAVDRLVGLFVKDAASALADAIAARKKAEELLAVYEQGEKEWNAQRAKLEQAKEALAREVAEERRNNEQKHKNLLSVQEAKRKLEEDLAKVRRHVGEKEWKAALCP